MGKEKAKNKFFIIEIFLLIAVSVSPVIPSALKLALNFLLLCIGFVRTVKQKKKPVIDKTFVLVLFFFFIPILFDLFYAVKVKAFSLPNLLYPFYFLCGYFYAKSCKKTEFYNAYEKVTYALAILSLVGMSVFFIAPSLIYSFPTYQYYDKTHRTIFFFNYLFDGGWMAVRNSGIAWEPGVFQILLNVAFQISIQKDKGKKLFVRTVIYSVAIILTRSTIGYVIFAINIFSLLKNNKKYIPVVIIAGLLCSTMIVTEVIYQLENKLAGSSAFNARWFPSINAIMHTWYRPLGLGGSYYDAVYETLNLGSFDCYTQILMRYGYPLLIYVLMKLWKIFKKDNPYVAIILLISFFSEPIWGSVLIVAMYYITEEDKHRCIHERVDNQPTTKK